MTNQTWNKTPEMLTHAVQPTSGVALGAYEHARVSGFACSHLGKRGIDAAAKANPATGPRFWSPPLT